MMMAPSRSASARPARIFPASGMKSHMHTAYWRVDIDLIDGNKNSAMLMRHLEDPESLAPKM